MKAIGKAVIAAGTILLASSPTQSLAIEGLQISVQCPNVTLGWPSQPGENYIVQWRPDLNPGTAWLTLTSSLPADWSSYWTSFTDSNRVQCTSGGTNSVIGGDEGPPPLPSFAVSATSTPLASDVMVKPADGSGSPVPLCLYPPGFDLTGFLILDPSTGGWASGAGYTITEPSSDQLEWDGPQPEDDDPGGDGSPPDPGFYQVVEDGVRIWGLTNLTGGVILSNTVAIMFEAANADPSGTNVKGVLDSASLVVDGNTLPSGGVLVAPPTHPWRLSMDTGFLENGDHNVWVEVSWRNTDSTDDNNYLITRYSDPFTITVSNVVYYPQWEPEIGEAGISAYFAKTTCTDADWQIDIYDVSSNRVQSLTGHTVDGSIEAYWNMVDTNGVSRTNAVLDPWFDATISVSDPATKQAPRKNQRGKDWPDHGQWVIAYQDYFKWSYSANNAMFNSINSFAWTGQAHGGAVLYYPQPGQTNDLGQTYPMRYQKTNHLDSTITPAKMLLDDDLLLRFLTNSLCRNFYYNGHGTPNFIGYYLGAAAVNHFNKYRYRFVFLASSTLSVELVARDPEFPCHEVEHGQEVLGCSIAPRFAFRS